MKKLFKVTYEGLWMGGIALVFAEDAKQAGALARDHKDTVKYTSVSIEEITDTSGVVYNYNGDY